MGDPPEPLAQYLLLDIGGVVVALLCNDPPTLARLRRHYAAFLADAGCKPLVVVNAFVDPSLPVQPVPRGEVYYNPAEQRLLMIGAEATLHLAQGAVQLWLAPGHILDNIEYTLRVVYALLAVQHGGLLLHAAGIVHQAQAYVFCGQSGSGKTTVARLAPPDAVLNDDLVLLLPHGLTDWQVHATPFSNPTQQPPAGRIAAPLARLLFLVQSPAVRLREVSPARALAELLAVVPVITSDATLGAQVMQIGGQLLASVAVHYLDFRPEPSFWAVLTTRKPPA